LRTVFPGWLQTTIFLISVSWIARIIDMSHQCLADNFICLNWHSCQWEMELGYIICSILFSYWFFVLCFL
jgi:hypothetical protein